MTSENFITDKKDFATSLFEEAFGVSFEHVLNNWKDYESIVPPGSVTNMLAAYKFAQDYKEELDFYGFLCFWLAYHVQDLRSSRLVYCEEALQYCKQPDLRKYIEWNYNYSKAIREKEYFEGVHPSANNRVKGIEKIAAVYGHNDWTLHDAEVKSMRYDRDKNTLDIEVDTFIPKWAEDNQCHIIPFQFSNILSIETDMDYGNDYFSTCHIYSENDYFYVEFESAHIKICSRNLSIGEIK